jgi:hypothetical protein
MIEVSMLSTHLAMPTSGHLEQAIHIFAYLKVNPKKRLALDPQNHVYDKTQYSPVANRQDFYRDAKEQIVDDSSHQGEEWYQCTDLLMQIMPVIA